MAKEALVGILDLLAPDDSFGIVLFSDSACAPLPFGPARCVDIPQLKQQARLQLGRGSLARQLGWPTDSCCWRRGS